MKKLLSLLVILAALSDNLSGQSEFGQETITSQVKTLELRNMGSRRYEDINGSPYDSYTYRESTVYFKNGNFATVSLRWDIFRDEMEFVKDNRIQWLIKKKVNYIKYGPDTIFLGAAEADTARPNYWLLKDNGQIKLFYRKVANFYPYVEPKGYMNSVPERFLREDDIIFISRDNHTPVRILSKRDLISVFRGDESAVRYIKSKKVRTDNIEDLHLLVTYLNARPDH